MIPLYVKAMLVAEGKDYYPVINLSQCNSYFIDQETKSITFIKAGGSPSSTLKWKFETLTQFYTNVAMIEDILNLNQTKHVGN